MKAHLIILNIFKISNINYKRHTYSVLHNKFIQDMESCWLDGTDELDYWLLLRLLSSYRSFGSRFWRGRSQKWVSTLCRVFLLMRLLAALEVEHLYCPVKRKWLQSHVLPTFVLVPQEWGIYLDEFSQSVHSQYGESWHPSLYLTVCFCPADFPPPSALPQKVPPSGLKQHKKDIHFHSFWHWMAGKVYAAPSGFSVIPHWALNLCWGLEVVWGVLQNGEVAAIQTGQSCHYRCLLSETAQV